jgi:SOS-response transcriptional repressor LexA
VSIYTLRDKINDMTTLGQRIQHLRDERKWSQKKLANKCGWQGVSRISMYERDRREPSLKVIEKLATIFGIAPEDLTFGTGQQADMASIYKKIPAGKIPVIGWHQAAQWTVNSGEAVTLPTINFITAPQPIDYNHNPFALIIKSNSMRGVEKTFNPGSVVIVDPIRTPVNNDYIVVCRYPDEAILRQLIIDGGEHYLKALDPQLPSIRFDDTWVPCGVVICHIDYTMAGIGDN